METQRVCEICGVVYSNAQKHQQFHDDIAAWIHLIELEVDARIRSERGRAEG